MTRSSVQSGTRIVVRAVAVVDQDPACAAGWKSALLGLGVRVDAMGEPATALASRYAVVVLGTMPPGTMAHDVARELATRPVGDRSRVVLVAREPPRRVDRIHLDAVLTRPVRVDALVEQVRRLLALDAPRAAQRERR